MPIAAVPIAAAAVLALLLLYASTTLATWLAQALPDWSFPGFSSLRSYVITVANVVSSEITDLLHSLITPLENAVAGPVLALFTTLQNALSSVSHLSDVVNWVKSTYLIQWVLNVEAYALNLSATAQTYAADLYSFAEGDIAALRSYAVALSQAAYTEAVGTVTNLIDQATAYAVALSQTAYTEAVGAATNLVNQAAVDTAALFNQAAADIVGAEQLAVGLFNTAETDIVKAISTAEGYANATATAVVGAAITDIDTAIGTVLGGIYTDIDTAVIDVVGIIGTGDQDILAGIRAIPTSVPLDIAGVASLAGATALTLTRYLRDCGIPNCQNLGQFGNDLSAVDTLFSAGAFLALIGELISNPGSAHTIYDDTLGPVVTAGESAARELLSI